MKFDFAKNAVVESIDTVPEDFRSFYEEGEDGKHKLSDAPAVKSAVKVIAGQAKALLASRSEAADNKKKIVDLSPLSTWGDSPSAIAESVTSKVEELQGEIAKGKDAHLDLDKVKESMKSAHGKDLEKKDTHIDALAGQLRKLLVVNAATAAIVKAGGNPKLLMPHVERTVSAVDEKGEFKVFVLGEDRKPRFSGVDSGEYMGIEELISEMKADEDYGRMFNSEAPSGGGAPPGAGGKPPPKGQKLNPVDKISAGLKKKQYVKK